MSAVRDELITLIERMNDVQQNRLLEAAREIAEKEHMYTARELLKLPRAERELIMRRAFQQAADESFEVFEAYSEEMIDDEP